MVEMNRQTLIDALRALEPDLRAEGVHTLALFGSRARADHRADSDVDLLIDVEEGRKFSLLDIVGVAQTVEDRIGLPANVFLRRSLDPTIRAQARRDERRVF